MNSLHYQYWEKRWVTVLDFVLLEFLFFHLWSCSGSWRRRIASIDAFQCILLTCLCLWWEKGFSSPNSIFSTVSSSWTFNITINPANASTAATTSVAASTATEATSQAEENASLCRWRSLEDSSLAEWPESMTSHDSALVHAFDFLVVVIFCLCVDDFRLFVGDLGHEVNDDILANAFSMYPSFQKAKVIREHGSKKSRGYGFVSFLDAADFAKAFREKNGFSFLFALFRPLALTSFILSCREIHRKSPRQAAKKQVARKKPGFEKAEERQTMIAPGASEQRLFVLMLVAVEPQRGRFGAHESTEGLQYRVEKRAFILFSLCLRYDCEHSTRCLRQDKKEKESKQIRAEGRNWQTKFQAAPCIFRVQSVAASVLLPFFAVVVFCWSARFVSPFRFLPSLSVKRLLLVV